jgi:hypothetical protein
MKSYQRNLKKKTNGVTGEKCPSGANSYIRFRMKLFFSDKEIQIFRCFNLIKLKFLFVFTTDPYKEIDRQIFLICFTI